MNLRRHRKPLSALLGGAWLFALFVGIANACATTSSPVFGGQGTAMAGDMRDQQPSTNCLQFCADDTPVFSKLQLVPDQPLGHALLIASEIRFRRTMFDHDAMAVQMAGNVVQVGRPRLRQP
jgi:uncharacterized protein (DUF305 family)